MEEILSRDNMKLAYKKVKANKGASGVDGIPTDEVLEYLNENWVHPNGWLDSQLGLVIIIKRLLKPQESGESQKKSSQSEDSLVALITI